jgi:tRNA uridine 5-carboxymethylaminomethyl modification enzyme
MVMKQRLEEQDGLLLLQDEAIGLALDSGTVAGIELRSRGHIECGAVVVTAGTFLRAAMVSGESRVPGARSGDAADRQFAESLQSLGIATRRFKTGTPPRIDGRTVDLSILEPQSGDPEPIWLSRRGRLGGITPVTLSPSAVHAPFTEMRGNRPQLACFRTSTNAKMHSLIRANLDRAPMFNGMIDGTGPRYCPSIEDKVARYLEKNEHPVFLEPEGWRSNELYVQGMSTSLPFDIQESALRLIPGLERAEISRFGYAVEYDAVDPNALHPTLECRSVWGLFLAGQVNGTSGYEEAAGQGIVAGINAARYVAGSAGITIPRTTAYIGVMIDDLVSAPFTEPYRMLTARAEFRLSLRPETANERLADLAFDHALIDEARMDSILKERRALQAGLDGFAKIIVKPNSPLDVALQESGQSPINKPMSLAELIRRPTMHLADLVRLAPDLVCPIIEAMPDHAVSRFEDELKYAVFVDRERREVARVSALNEQVLPTTAGPIPGLRNEARQQIELHRPRTFGDAQRIAGVTAADISALLVHAARTDHALP